MHLLFIDEQICTSIARSVWLSWRVNTGINGFEKVPKLCNATYHFGDSELVIGVSWYRYWDIKESCPSETKIFLEASVSLTLCGFWRHFLVALEDG